MKSLIPINQSVFSDEFESVNLENTFLLSKIDAKNMWENYIDKNSRPFHLLDDLHWLYSGHSNDIGNWIDAYNNDDYRSVSAILDSFMNWQDEEELLFFMSRFFVIRTTWKDFKSGWINFLMSEDDSPVLLNEKKLKKVLVFTPLGRITRCAIQSAR